MWMYVCVYAYTHTHTAQMGYSVVSPGVEMRHLESRKNPDRLKRNIHVDCIGVHSSEAKIAFIIARKEIME